MVFDFGQSFEQVAAPGTQAAARASRISSETMVVSTGQRTTPHAGVSLCRVGPGEDRSSHSSRGASFGVQKSAPAVRRCACCIWAVAASTPRCRCCSRSWPRLRRWSTRSSANASPTLSPSDARPDKTPAVARPHHGQSGPQHPPPGRERYARRAGRTRTRHVPGHVLPALQRAGGRRRLIDRPCRVEHLWRSRICLMEVGQELLC